MWEAGGVWGGVMYWQNGSWDETQRKSMKGVNFGILCTRIVSCVIMFFKHRSPDFLGEMNDNLI